MAEQQQPDRQTTGPVAVAIGRRPEPVHDVAVYAFDGMTSFELGVVVEVFGLARPELSGLLAAPWYGLKVCADRPGTALRAVGGFSLTAHHGLDDLAAADTVVIPGVPNAFSGVGAPPAWSPRCARRTNAAPGSSRSARAPSRWPPPACWTATRPPRTGGTPNCSSSATRRCASTRTSSTWTAAPC